LLVVAANTKPYPLSQSLTMKNIITLTLFALAHLAVLPLKAVPKLSSYPSAQATIFLDFDGHFVNSGVWNGGNPFACAASGLSDVQVTEVFNRVAEDYRPFNLNITTDSAVFLNAPLDKRIRMIITPTSSWYPGVGGITWVNSFVWGDDTPGFIFADQLGPFHPKYIAECCAHESGHALGLSHQSRYDGSNCSSPIEPYNSGNGTGEAGWAPIMGNSYGRNMTNWNNGPTQWGCNSVQDNLSIISSQSSIGFRTDDYAAAFSGSATTLAPLGFTVNGVISTNTDKDVFKLALTQNSAFHIIATPFNVGTGNDGANLDIKMELYNAAGLLLRTFDPAATMGVTADTNLIAGTYYLLVDGTGNSNIGEYGSLGSYTLNGFSAALPVKSVTLSGNSVNGKHALQWTVIADEPVKSVTVETATDGQHFTSTAALNAGAANFTWQPYQNGAVYYRVKVTTAAGNSTYSNIIILKAAGITNNNFTVSTFIQSNSISVNAPETYRYQITGINGVIIQKGSGTKGFNMIAVNSLPAGMYIMQLSSHSIIQTERIIRQ
jgi:hypothetical protein